MLSNFDNHLAGVAAVEQAKEGLGRVDKPLYHGLPHLDLALGDPGRQGLDALPVLGHPPPVHKSLYPQLLTDGQRENVAVLLLNGLRGGIGYTLDQYSIRCIYIYILIM